MSQITVLHNTNACLLQHSTFKTLLCVRSKVLQKNLFRFLRFHRSIGEVIFGMDNDNGSVFSAYDVKSKLSTFNSTVIDVEFLDGIRASIQLRIGIYGMLCNIYSSPDSKNEKKYLRIFNQI